MAKSGLSNKHLQINKAATTITAVLAIASFVAVISIVGARAMLQQRSYQAKVIKEKELAVKTLKQNIASVELLGNSYKEFTARPENMIGGISTGTGERDGDNAKIILDALPSTYDFPALVSSIEKILSQNNLTIESITGTDDEIAQLGKESSSTPEVVEIPFEFTVSGSYDSFYALIGTLERSIRPIKVDSIQFSSNGSGATMTVKARTYYQSGKKLDITTKVVK